MKLINKTANGQLAFCKCQNQFHLEFSNILVNLTYEELNRLTKYIATINCDYYLDINKNSFNRRKLLLNIGSSTIFLCLNTAEFKEFKELLNLKKKGKLLNTADIIDFEIVFN